MDKTLPWIVGITGASGTVYARRLVAELAQLSPVEVVITEAAFRVMHEEEGLASSIRKISVEDLLGSSNDNVKIYSNRDIGAPIASGSYQTQGMVVIPCSMKTLSGIANGYSASLVERAADVVLKEKRKLVLVPRETPLSVIHLRNMLTLAEAGASIVPAMPGFYHQPKSIEDLVDMMVMRVLDQMGLKANLATRWREEGKEKEVRYR